MYLPLFYFVKSPNTAEVTMQTSRAFRNWNDFFGFRNTKNDLIREQDT